MTLMTSVYFFSFLLNRLYEEIKKNWIEISVLYHILLSISEKLIINKA